MDHNLWSSDSTKVSHKWSYVSRQVHDKVEPLPRYSCLLRNTPVRSRYARTLCSGSILHSPYSAFLYKLLQRSPCVMERHSGHRLSGASPSGLCVTLQRSVLVLKVIRLKDWLAFTRRHSVVSMHEKTRIARTEITHVSIRYRAKSCFHVIWQFTVVVFLWKLTKRDIRIYIDCKQYISEQ